MSGRDVQRLGLVKERRGRSQARGPHGPSTATLSSFAFAAPPPRGANLASVWSLGPQGSVPARGAQGEPAKGPDGGTELSFSVQMDVCTLFCIFLTGNLEAWVSSQAP